MDAVQVVEFRISRSPMFPVPASHVPESEPDANRKTEPPRVVTATPTIVVQPTPPVEPKKKLTGTAAYEEGAQGAFGAILARVTAPGAMIGFGYDDPSRSPPAAPPGGKVPGTPVSLPHATSWTLASVTLRGPISGFG